MQITKSLFNFAPGALDLANQYFQESGRNPNKSLVPPLAAQTSYALSTSLRYSIKARKNPDAHYFVYPYQKVLLSLAMTWALCAYKGHGEKSWLPQWGVCVLTPFAQEILLKTFNCSESKMSGSESSLKYYGRLATVCCIVPIAQQFFLTKLQVKRNPSLSFNSYFAYGAGVAILKTLYKESRKNKLLGQCSMYGFPIETAVSTSADLVAAVTIPLLMSGLTRMFLDQSVQISWKWEIGTAVGKAAIPIARYFLLD